MKRGTSFFLAAVSISLLCGLIPQEQEQEQLDSELLEEVKLGNLPSVKKLLESGANPNSYGDWFGMGSFVVPVLIHAAAEGHVEVVSELLDAGAEIDSKESLYRGTALHYAAGRGHTEVVKLLLSRGAYVDMRMADDEKGTTPLMNSARSSDPQVSLFLSKEADPNILNAAGFTAMGYCIRNQRCRVSGVKELLAAGADPNLEDVAGYTLLSLCLLGEGCSLEIVEALLKHGADPTGQGPSGAPLRELAKSRGEEFAQLLEKYLAQ